jgi:solute carrier family 25 (mitochondrial S-adenosylmethionine transporter), member 26
VGVNFDKFCNHQAACVVRVPVEVVKQRRQTTARHSSAMAVARAAIQREGLRGLYRGFSSTVAREIPFSVIQFSLWEAFKERLAIAQGVRHLDPGPTSLCGALAGTCFFFNEMRELMKILGGISAALTTPLDVAKTRIMLAESANQHSILSVLRSVHAEKGVKG